MTPDKPEPAPVKRPGTPLPWKWVADDKEVDPATYQSPGYYDNKELGNANGDFAISCGEYDVVRNPQDAAYIVEACNAYPALQTALQAAEARIREMEAPAAEDCKLSVPDLRKLVLERGFEIEELETRGEYDGMTAKEWYEAWDKADDHWQALIAHHSDLEDAVQLLLQELEHGQPYAESLNVIDRIMAQTGNMLAENQAKRDAATEKAWREGAEAMQHGFKIEGGYYHPGTVDAVVSRLKEGK